MTETLLYILFIYITGAVIGWAYVGWQTGKEFTKVKRANPGVGMQINWASVFYQGLVWVALFASLAAEQWEDEEDEEEGIYPPTGGSNVR